jgi:hypothetical protein
MRNGITTFLQFSSLEKIHFFGRVVSSELENSFPKLSEVCGMMKVRWVRVKYGVNG